MIRPTTPHVMSDLTVFRLAAIALPAYQNYMQRSANNACLAEAKSWMNSAVSDFAIDGKDAKFSTPTNKACAVSASSTSIAKPTARGANPTGSAIAGWANFTGDLYFAPQTRGNIDEFQATKCNTATSSCELVAKK